MTQTVIKIENLSKIYRLGQIGTGTISHDLNRWWAMNLRGKEDPFAKVGHVNDRTAKAEKGELVAALSNINLEVHQGEVLGIIGKNGAGKSTLLKILSRVTSPTTGSIKVKGHMASLLEVGTGFHPEMTGRENLYMNGTIMGMRRHEITRKLDEIVEFAGVAKYLDTPVKRYSSGMTVRLGFAIAAHLEPEILIVDEVLAVGDAEFQNKAIGKMQDVSKNDGRTVLFVSHNMASLQNLCNAGMLLNQGAKIFEGGIQETIGKYLDTAFKSSSIVEYSNKKFKSPHSLMVKSIKLLDIKTLQLKSSFNMGEDFIIETSLVSDNPINDIGINIRMNDSMNNQIAAWRTSECLNRTININKELTIKTKVKNLNVFDGNYNLSIAIIRGLEKLDYIENAISFDIVPSLVPVFNKVVSRSLNMIYTASEWSFEK